APATTLARMRAGKPDTSPAGAEGGGRGIPQSAGASLPPPQPSPVNGEGENTLPRLRRRESSPFSRLRNKSLPPRERREAGSGHAAERGGITAPTPTLPRKRGGRKHPPPPAEKGIQSLLPPAQQVPPPAGAEGGGEWAFRRTRGHHCPHPNP